MTLELLFGLGLIAIGAFSSGSFSIPFGKTRNWAWENYWLIYSLFAYVIIPAVACLIFCPGFMNVLTGLPAQTSGWIFGLGIIYGICNLTFGLSLRYLGLSLGFALSLGLMMVLGTIIPPAIDGRLSVMLQQSGGTILIIGILIAIVGVAFSGYAGYLKDKNAGADANSELNFGKGLVLVFFVGITGASQALGIEQGAPISALLVESGVDPLFQTLPVFLLLFNGSFLVTALWCLFLAMANGDKALYPAWFNPIEQPNGSFHCYDTDGKRFLAMMPKWDVFCGHALVIAPGIMPATRTFGSNCVRMHFTCGLQQIRH